MQICEDADGKNVKILQNTTNGLKLQNFMTKTLDYMTK